MQNLSFLKNTQFGKILSAMRRQPLRWFVVSDFCNPQYQFFVGYKASTRLAELQCKGLVQSRPSKKFPKFKEYKILDNKFQLIEKKLKV